MTIPPPAPALPNLQEAKALLRPAVTPDQLQARWKLGEERRVVEWKRWGPSPMLSTEADLRALLYQHRRVWYDYRDHPVNQAHREAELQVEMQALTW